MRLCWGLKCASIMPGPAVVFKTEGRSISVVTSPGPVVAPSGLAFQPCKVTYLRVEVLRMMDLPPLCLASSKRLARLAHTCWL